MCLRFRERTVCGDPGAPYKARLLKLADVLPYYVYNEKEFGFTKQNCDFHSRQHRAGLDTVEQITVGISVFCVIIYALIVETVRGNSAF